MQRIRIEDRSIDLRELAPDGNLVGYDFVRYNILVNGSARSINHLHIEKCYLTGQDLLIRAAGLGEQPNFQLVNCSMYRCIVQNLLLLAYPREQNPDPPEALESLFKKECPLCNKSETAAASIDTQIG